MRTSLSLLVSLVAVATAACGSRAAAPVGNTSGQPPTGPAPAVDLQANDGSDYPSRFSATGLPAVAQDGQRVVVAVIGEDGARGAPNLALVEKDRADTVVHQLVVQSADDGEAFADPEAAPPPPTAKLAEANRYLTETHAQRGWTALAPMTLDGNSEEDGYGQTHRAQADGVAVTWDEGKLTVAVGGRTVVDRATQGWTVAPVEHCDGCGVCVNPSFLGAAWLDAARQLIVVRISYIGNDSCWEPDSTSHVVAW